MSKNTTLFINSSSFKLGKYTTSKTNVGGTLKFAIKDRGFTPFSQSCIHQEIKISKQAPNANKPYFSVRHALPIPTAYTKTEQGSFVGLDEGVYAHNHSPGFEILPNGDALAIYFSTPKGHTENDIYCTFVQARLRFGAEEWDFPELFMNTIDANDQSALLWNDNGKIWFFGGGRDISDYIPFRIATSEDNGATWTFSIPQIEKPMENVSPQPISNAFRDPQGRIYVPTDGKDSSSLLWRSEDEGITWYDMGGRTSTRHSTIVPLDDQGNLLSAAGKNSDINGWNSQSISHDWGKTWENPIASPFPPLGSGQRPNMIRLASGALLLVGDSYMLKKKIPAPEGWQQGNDCYVAISRDNGKNWKFKSLPIGLPHQAHPGTPSLGYTVVRQAPNGVIHIITSSNLPGLHYEFNEAWLNSDEKEVTWSGEVTNRQTYEEYYNNGELKSRWQAHTIDGKYLLDGKMIDNYPNGQRQHEAFYKDGYKIGIERFWENDGTLRWQWERDLKTYKGIWTQYWPNGNKRLVSEWNLRPTPRDLNKPFTGYFANGIASHYDSEGTLIKTYHFSNGRLRDK